MMITNRVPKKIFDIKTHYVRSARTITTPKGHDEPAEIAAQWLVKQDPSLFHCPLACKTKICPKPGFFPRFRKVEIPAEIYSGKRKPKVMTWYEYFSYLLPDSMTAPKPAPRTCRKMLELRQDTCLDPQDWACCDVACMKQPLEWHGQATVHAIISKEPALREAPMIKPCAPPDHVVPRCVFAKKGIVPQIKESPICYYPDARYKEPFSDIKGFSKSADSGVNQYKCKYKCYEDIPKVHEKSLKLACRWFSEYKDVNCPEQMFTRYKSIRITPKGDIKPTDATEQYRRIEIKKGVCGRQTLLRPPSIRNFSTSSNQLIPFSTKRIDTNDPALKEFMKLKKPSPQPGKDFINVDALKAQAGFDPDPILNPEPHDPPYRNPPYLDMISEKSEDEKAKPVTKPLYFSTRNAPLNPRSIRDKFDAKKSTIFRKVELFSTSAIVNQDEKKKGKPKKEKTVCSGCPGVLEALGPKAKGLYVEKCRTAKRGQCRNIAIPGAPKPCEPEITSPYFKCRSPILSKCNHPREPQPKKPEDKTLPCRQKKEFHTSAIAFTSCESSKSACDGNKSPPCERKRAVLATDIERDSCDCFKPKPKGILCRIAGVFGIGCAKKKK